MLYLETVWCVVLAVFFLKVMNSRHVFEKYVTVDFPLFFFLGIVAYMLLPLIEVCIIGSSDMKTEYAFVKDVLLSLFFLVFGVLFSEMIREKGRFGCSIREPYTRKPFKKGVIIVSIGALFLTFLYIVLIFGGVSNYFRQQYGLYNADNMGSFTAILPYSAVGYILVMNNRSIVNSSRLLNLLTRIVSVLLILMYMLGGNRNLGAMMGIAFVFSIFYEKKILLSKYVPAFVVLIVMMGVIAVGREYGMLNFLTGNSSVTKNDLTRYIFSVKMGEFGTMRRFQEYYVPGVYQPNVTAGFSYVISPIINLIPTIVWPTRPNTIASEYTAAYWESRNEISAIGLGFSPIVEAKINFGYMWPIMFFVIGVFIFSSFFKARPYIKRYVLFGSCSAVVLNFFRIDFAITVKFFLLIMITSNVIVKFLSIRNQEGN